MTPPTRTPAQRAELEAFSRKLVDLMAKRGMNQSDLARHLWGSHTDARGRDVATNRDRISHYVRGSQMPEAKTMRRIAQVFGVDPDELHPTVNAPPGAVPEVSLAAVAGRPDLALLQVHVILPMNAAIKVASIISEARHTKDGDER
jgi:transcriptional regulator with XRE-family HTH domain